MNPSENSDAAARRPQDWAPMSAAVRANPVGALDEMRATCPVAYSDWRGWSLFRYEDIVNVCADPQTFSNAEPWQDLPQSGLSIPLRMDPPEHTRYRRLLQKFLRPDRIRQFEPTVRDIAARLLEPILARGHGEMIAEFADPFPVQALCAFVGWQESDWQQLKVWFRQAAETRFSRDHDAFVKNQELWDSYISAVIDDRRRAPREDMTSWLLAAQLGEEEPLPDEHILAILRLLLQAGHGTTTASLGICIHYLAANPQAQDHLRQNPVAIPAAIEEILRWDAPLTSMPRLATRDVTVGGRNIRAGDEISLMYGAANRDETAFPDADKCILDRRPNRHLVFGSGIHTCIGAPFARQELKIALELLFAQTQGFELAGDSMPTRAEFPASEFATLPVRFDAR